MSASTAVAPVRRAQCELCHGGGLCPQCAGYGELPDRDGRSGDACPLCAGETCCPQCTGTGTASAVTA